MKQENKTKHQGLRISKVLLLSIFKVGIPVIFGIAVFIELFTLIEKKNLQAQAALIQTDILAKTDTVTYNENPLEKVENPDIDTFFEKYYAALSTGDIDTVCTMQDSITDTDRITIEKQAEYIDSYNNVVCYTKDGLEEGTYFVFVVHDVKFNNIEATAPAMTVFYVYTKEDGTLTFQGKMSDEVLEVLPSVYADQEVTDLFNKIEVEYTEAITNSEELGNFLAELPGILKTNVGEALAQLEAEEMANIADGEVATTDAVEANVLSGDAVFQVLALDTVNVRKSDSSEADKIGKVSKGEILTCLEEKINGWSKVMYEGKEAYIKSTFLEKISSVADGEVIGTVKANNNVNVRAAASQDSAKLGVASMGTVYNLLEDLGEWYHIDYEGKNGYVKAEYFTK